MPAPLLPPRPPTDGLTRRQLLAATAAAVTLQPLRALAAAPTVEPIGDGLFVIAGVGGNVVVRAAADRQLLIDSGEAGSTAALSGALSALPGGGRVPMLFNTHWHPEQIGGNAVFGRAGATIVAHEKTRLRLANEYFLAGGDTRVPPAPADAWPDESFYTTGSTTFAGERIDYGYLLEAHTDGDIYVWFRDANVVAVGDVLAPARDPELDWFGGGWLGGRADALTLLLEMTDAGTRFVPGYGPVVGREYLEAERALMDELYDRVQEHLRKGMGAADMLAAGIVDGLPRQLDDPERFLHDAYSGMWAHHNTLSHDIV